jgi:hypothetical protein
MGLKGALVPALKIGPPCSGSFLKQVDRLRRPKGPLLIPRTDVQPPTNVRLHALVRPSPRDQHDCPSSAGHVLSAELQQHDQHLAISWLGSALGNCTGRPSVPLRLGGSMRLTTSNRSPACSLMNGYRRRSHRPTEGTDPTNRTNAFEG